MEVRKPRFCSEHPAVFFLSSPIIFWTNSVITNMVYQGTKKGEDIYQKTYDCILSISRWLEDQESEAFKPLGITRQQYNVLQILRDKHPESCSATFIKETMAEKNP